MARTSTLSASARLLKYLQSGRDITAAQARQRFGISNISARISELRQAGFAIYLNEKTTKQGYTIKAYRLGSPTRTMVAVANLVMGDPSLRSLVGEVLPTVQKFSSNLR